MSNDPESLSPQKIIKSNDWRVVYANTFGLVFGDNDVRITLALDQDPQKPGTELLEQVAVMMTPRTAKILAHTLSFVIANYEVAHGVISMPQEIIDKLNAGLQQHNETNKKTMMELAKEKK
jgi:hypothetical protein